MRSRDSKQIGSKNRRMYKDIVDGRIHVEIASGFNTYSILWFLQGRKHNFADNFLYLESKEFSCMTILRSLVRSKGMPINEAGTCNDRHFPIKLIPLSCRIILR